MVGRPREFERSAVLERAMEAFWERGYEATSMQDLVDCMGINRGSMYATFGGKRPLFLEALQHYIDQSVERVANALMQEGSPRGNIESLMRTLADTAQCPETCCRGCLLVNSVNEMAPHDEDVRAMLRAWIERCEDLFTRTLIRARDAGEIGKSRSPRALARMLLSTVFGVKTLGKVEPSKKTIRDIVDTALSSLD